MVRCDNRGMRYLFPMDRLAVKYARKVAHGISKGLIRGSSFAGNGAKYRFDTEGGKDIAYLIDLDSLRDCGPVNHPAYTGANTTMWSAYLDEQYKNLDSDKGGNREAISPNEKISKCTTKYSCCPSCSTNQNNFSEIQNV